MDSDGRTDLRRILAPEDAEHLAFTEYAAIQFMHVVAERDAAVLERDNAFQERNSALDERDAAFLQRDIAVAERDGAIIERDNAVTALDAATGHRIVRWNNYRRREDIREKDMIAMQMGLPITDGFRLEEPHTLSADAALVGNSDRMQPEKEGSKSKRRKKLCEAAGTEALKLNEKIDSQQHGEQWQEVPGEVLPLATGIQDIFQQLPKDRDRSFTGLNQSCNRLGNGAWQSATTMALHPLSTNPKKRRYRSPGQSMVPTDMPPSKHLTD